MLTFAQLKEVLKENQIKGYFHYTKSKFIDLLDKRGLIPETYETNKQVKQRRILKKISMGGTMPCKEGRDTWSGNR